MRGRGRGLLHGLAALGLTVGASPIASPVVAAAPIISLPAGSIAAALAQLARIGGVDIGGSDPAFGRLVTPGVTDARGVAAALTALLERTPFTFNRIDAHTYRIVRRPALPSAAATGPPSRRPPSAPITRDSDIVVTGGKRDVPLATYPGSAEVLTVDDGTTGPHGWQGQDWLLSRTAILQSTELGVGRNKLFIRGVADSSFTGPTQSTVGTYFGEVRTGYNGPDPNLNLYDMERIEVLEGPQGALYGAGSIGGIIRLTPKAADLSGFSASADGGGAFTAHGAPGYDTAAMVNLAPWQDHAAIRVVGYRSVEGGYIDDPGRGLSNVNRQVLTGGRIAVRLRPVDGWTLDAGYLIQSGHQPDLQYASDGLGPLTRLSAIAQPFEDDYRLIRGVLTKRWLSGLTLVGTVGRVAHDTDQRYDVTRPGMASPVAYDERNSIRFTSFEARLSQTLASGFGWLIGAARLSDDTETGRTYGPLDQTRELVGVTNRTRETAGYAQLTVPLWQGFALTAGGRYTDARMDGEPSISPVNRDFIRGQTSRRFDPGAGFSWRFAPRLAWFGQYQQGFRTGGLAVARGVGRVATYQADEVRVGETGFRLLRDGAIGLSASAAISYTQWTDIQADLVSRSGFPYTANVGNGEILAFEGSLDWAITPRLRATAGLFLNRSRLDDPAPDYVSSGARPLPATPARSATGRLAWSRPLGRDLTLKLDGDARYISHSRLGVGPVLDLRYGNYVVAGASAAVSRGPAEVSLAVTNLLDSTANRFAIGNPFGIQYRDEVTPLRPRTIRLGLAARF